MNLSLSIAKRDDLSDFYEDPTSGECSITFNCDDDDEENNNDGIGDKKDLNELIGQLFGDICGIKESHTYLNDLDLYAEKVILQQKFLLAKDYVAVEKTKSKKTISQVLQHI